MSVDDLAQTTKIPVSSLRALEEGQTALLPAPVFVRGFIRAYASAVGVEAAELIRSLEAPESDRTGDGVPQEPAEKQRLSNLVGLDAEPRRFAGFRASQLLLVVIAVSMFLAAWFLAGNRSSSQQAAGIEPPREIQQRVDGVSIYTSSPRSER